MTKSQEPYLVLIRGAIEAVRKYKPDDFGELKSNQMAQDAIIMRLQQIGELLAHIRAMDPAHFEDKADITWHRMIGLRNVISHAYDKLDLNLIWAILENGLSEFERSLMSLEQQ